MFTSIDKALAAAIMGILFTVQTSTGLRVWWATPDTIATIIGLLTPVLVWATPNKKAAGARWRRSPRAEVPITMAIRFPTAAEPKK